MLIHRGVARLAAVVYFVQGSLGIAGIALPLFLRAQGYSIARITLITSVASAPWFFKIVYGAISDAVPIGRLRRKPYLIICSILSCIGWVCLSVLPSNEKWLIVSMMIANLGFAATDVITDGLVVEYSRKETAQTYQAIAWGARSVGSILSGYLGGMLAAKVSAQNVFLITAALPLISLVGALFLKEKEHPRGIRPKNILIPIVESVGDILRGDIKWFVLFLFLISSSVAIGTPLFFYMRETLKFEEIFLGLLSSVTWFGATIGCFIFLRFFQRAPLRKTLYWAISIGFIDILMTLLIRDRGSAFVIALLLGILGYMVLLPMFSAAARLVHGTGVESSLYAILMSIFNVGQAVAGFVGGMLNDLIGLNLLIVLTAVFGLFALFVIGRLKTL
ncbi:MAG: MFS transporter [Candidatus Omnitrophica bacterium]|nr:MFS transporter [Candidatus Omnitrophota bacterium]